MEYWHERPYGTMPVTEVPELSTAARRLFALVAASSMLLCVSSIGPFTHKYSVTRIAGQTGRASSFAITRTPGFLLITQSDLGSDFGLRRGWDWRRTRLRDARPSGIPSPPSYEWGGARWGIVLGRKVNVYNFAGKRVTEREVVLRLPTWFLLLVSAVLPGLWTIRAARPMSPASRHLCRECGYDLRASPTRCPECGMATPNEKAGTTNGMG